MNLAERGSIQLPIAGIPPVAGEPVRRRVVEVRKIFRLEGDVPVQAEGEKVSGDVGETFRARSAQAIDVSHRRDIVHAEQDAAI